MNVGRKEMHVITRIWDLLNIISSLLKAAAREWWRDNIFQMAASIAFYTIFSLAPIILISVGVASLFFSEQEAQAQIVREIENLTGAEGGKVARQVIRNMGTLVGQGPKAIVFGLIAVVIGSTAVFVNMQSSLNQIWRVEVKPNRNVIKSLVKDRLRSFGIVLTVGFLLLVSMVFSAFLSGVQQIMADRVHGISWLWSFVNTMVSFGVVTLLFARRKPSRFWSKDKTPKGQ
jgi:membrane protein